MGYDWIFDGIERSSFWWSDQENTQNGGLRSRPMIWDILLRDNPWMWTNNRFPSGLTKHQAARIGFPSLKSPNQQRPRHVFTFPSLPPAVAGTATPPPAGRWVAAAAWRVAATLQRGGPSRRMEKGKAVGSVLKGKIGVQNGDLADWLVGEPWLTNDMVNWH